MSIKIDGGDGYVPFGWPDFQPVPFYAPAMPMPFMNDPRDAHIVDLRQQLEIAHRNTERLLALLERSVPKPVEPGPELPVVASVADGDEEWVLAHTADDEEEADDEAG